MFYGVEESTVLRTTENGNFGRFTANSSERATIQSAEMNTRWFNFDLYEESSGTWRLSISCGKQGNPTEVDNNESEQQARAARSAAIAAIAVTYAASVMGLLVLFCVLRSSFVSAMLTVGAVVAYLAVIGHLAVGGCKVESQCIELHTVLGE